ncbi:methionine adenosyltransferase [Aerococcaceae bacterium DSM 111020]|nr:methionine adenosyltransferase [Aerococcaceae bacterium DSM 111020]
MQEEKYLFTSESVTEGHPDKIADQISDAILDAILEQDPLARVACETIVNTGLVVVFGEITTEAYVDIQAIARQTIREIGYTDRLYGFDADNVAVLVSLDEQSPDIAQGVNEALEERETHSSTGEENSSLIGAGDQGLMFGYASNETPEYMPLAISLSHQLAYQLAKVRKEGTLDYLGPDGKTQVTIEYDQAGQPLRVDNIVISTQHSEETQQQQLHQDIIEYVIEPIVPSAWLDDETTYYINPTGKFVIGGPVGDSGLTGRKIIVDTYGGAAHHGGGAFSGKDATKVDRSASYAARYIAKNLVAAGVCDRCEIQLAYAIGVSEPTSIMVDTFQTSAYSNATITQAVREIFQLTPNGIIEMMNLRQPIYKATAAYGHFGRTDIDLPWERVDQVAAIQQALN